ncbi:DUF1015 domain-containing protein [Peptoniphilus catoniae]|uniref:DUF1015 domain-containing protein n=1 Tax=Peptoniphilus catoniae TaxID=1660341 RepID=UPI0010FD4B8E|nr:DUF1015 family protein [Peptoniphilus catoniae]
MATIKPFKAIRPVNSSASRIAALPYDVYSVEEAKEEIKRENLSFLKVDLPLASLEENSQINKKDINLKALNNFKEMVNQGYFVKDKEDCFYLYRLESSDHSQTGLVCTTSVDEYLNDTIKKHEYTRSDKEEDRTDHIDKLDANTGLIFLTYRTKADIKNIIENVKKSDPYVDFISPDGVRHSLWLIKDKSTIEKLIEAFKKVENLYIADGHHRSASAVKVAQARRKEFPNYGGNEEFNYFMSILFDSDSVKIYDYNRVVKDLNNNSPKELLKKLSKDFDILKVNKAYKPQSKGQFGMYLNGDWYKLTYRGEEIKDPIAKLDVSILQNKILSPYLGIRDPRTDNRIDFIGGIRGMEELEKRVKSDMKVAFSLYPTSLEEVMGIADLNFVMPPKSTWFEPKPRSGLFIHELK